MFFAVRTSKLQSVRSQFAMVLGVSKEQILAFSTLYSGITLLSLRESEICNLNSTRNIEALLLDESAAAELRDPMTNSETLAFQSLYGVDAIEQYEYLMQLLYTQKCMRD